eukprot:COSAG01_NODE_17140_length_1175_cov_0.962825_1_plen_95_part_10
MNDGPVPTPGLLRYKAQYHGALQQLLYLEHPNSNAGCTTGAPQPQPRPQPRAQLPPSSHLGSIIGGRCATLRDIVPADAAYVSYTEHGSWDCVTL